MSQDLASLYIKVDATGVVTASKSLDDLHDKSRKVETATQSMESNFKKMSASAALYGAAIGAAFAALAKSSIDAFMESEKAMMKLSIAMKNQGDFSREAAKDMEEYAAAMQKVTQFEDDLIISQMATLKSFGMTNEEIKRTIQAAADMSAQSGESIESISNLLGKAYAGQTAMLARYGIIIDDTIPKSKKFEEVLKQLEQRFGGSAQAQLQTYAGQWAHLKNIWGDIQEFLGLTLLKTLEGLLFGAGMVGVAFLTMGEKILGVINFLMSPLTVLLETIAFTADKLGKPEIAQGIRAITTAVGTAQDSIRATKNEVLGWTNQQYEALKATEKTFDVVEKMGKTGKRTTYDLKDKDTSKDKKTSLIEETFDVDKYRSGLEQYEKLSAELNIKLASDHDAAMMKIYETDRRTYGEINKLMDDGVINAEQANELYEKLALATGKSIKDFYDNELTKSFIQFQKNINDLADTFGRLGSACSEMASIYEEGSSSANRWTEAAKAMEIAQRSLAVVNAVAAVAASATAPFPAGFVAMGAMLASMISLLATIGESIGGSSSSAPSVSKSSSVLGSDEQSQSVSKAYELMQESYDMQFTKLTGIYDQLKDLNQNITGLVTSIVRTGGISASGMNIKTGGGYSSLVSGYTNFDKSISEFTKDIFTPAGLVNLIGGDIAKYDIGAQLTNWIFDKVNQGIQWLGNGLLGGKTETKISQTGLAMGSMSIADIMSGGVDAQQYAKIKKTTDGGWFNSDETKISYAYQALDSSITDMLNKVFRNLSGSLISLSELFGTDTQKAMDYVFEETKLNLKGKTTEEINTILSDYINTISDEAAEALFGGVIKQYQQLNEGLYETAVRLVQDKEVISELMEMTGASFEGTTEAAIAFSEELISIAGSLDELTEAFNSYYENFFSDAEKQLNTQRQLTETLAAYNLLLPETREGFRALVESQVGVNNEAYVSLLKASGAASDYYKYIEDAAQDAADKAKEAAEKALEARKSSLNNELDARRSAYQERYNEQLNAMNSSLDVLTGYVDKLKSARESMKLDDIYSYRQRFGSAKSGLFSLLNQVRGGNFSGIESADDMLSMVTAISPKQYSTREAYLKDYNQIYNALREMEGITGNAKSAAERQIEILQKTYEMQMEAFDAQKSAIDNLTVAICTRRNVTGFAEGGIGSGWNVVGEKGAELINFGSSSNVVSNADSKAIFNADGIINAVNAVVAEMKRENSELKSEILGMRNNLDRFESMGMKTRAS